MLSFDEWTSDTTARYVGKTLKEDFDEMCDNCEDDVSALPDQIVVSEILELDVFEDEVEDYSVYVDLLIDIDEESRQVRGFSLDPHVYGDDGYGECDLSEILSEEDEEEIDAVIVRVLKPLMEEE